MEKNNNLKITMRRERTYDAISDFIKFDSILFTRLVKLLEEDCRIIIDSTDDYKVINSAHSEVLNLISYFRLHNIRGTEVSEDVRNFLVSKFNFNDIDKMFILPDDEPDNIPFN